jgi:hypothetical protein
VPWIHTVTTATCATFRTRPYLDRGHRLARFLKSAPNEEAVLHGAEMRANLQFETDYSHNRGGGGRRTFHLSRIFYFISLLPAFVSEIHLQLPSGCRYRPTRNRRPCLGACKRHYHTQSRLLPTDLRPLWSPSSACVLPYCGPHARPLDPHALTLSLRYSTTRWTTGSRRSTAAAPLGAPAASTHRHIDTRSSVHLQQHSFVPRTHSVTIQSPAAGHEIPCS